MSREEYEAGEPRFETADEQAVRRVGTAINEMVAATNECLGNIVNDANERIRRCQAAATGSWLIALVLAFVLGGILLQPR